MPANAAQDIIEASLREAGLSVFGLLSRDRLLAACCGLSDEVRERCGLESTGGAAVAALAYGEGPPEPPPWAVAIPGPLARIGRFARANWYAELLARLEEAAVLARGALAAAGADPGIAADWRRFANSCLPEKRLALEAGLGRIGRNGLLLTPGAGSAIVLGLLLFPAAIEPTAPQSARPTAPGLGLSEHCMDCGLCVASCPTGALRGDGTLERELCLQHWSSVPGTLPAAVEAAWGDRLYGCDACQEACPRFRPDPEGRISRGLLGPGLPAQWVAAASDGELKRVLRGSALGMGWISPEALRRNARHLT
jgi:epoxyqueuosine reductase